VPYSSLPIMSGPIEQGHSISSIRSLQLEVPPSCVEFCPAHPNFFVVGTYNLQKDEARTAEPEPEPEPDNEPEQKHTEARQNRDGSLVVFELEDDDV
jgi:diphthine methyl ester acylhydrolase